MRFIGSVIEKLQRHPKRIVFPEGTEPRVLQAARQFHSLRLGAPILLGDRTEIKEAAAALNVSLEGVRIINPAESEDLDNFARRFEILRRYKGMKSQEARDAMIQPSYFGAMMVAMHQADGFVSGTSQHVTSVLRPLFQIIKVAPQTTTASSCKIMEVEDSGYGEKGVIFMADCGVIPEPTVEQLADIAVSTAQLARQLLGVRPRVALLSFSTKGSANHPSIGRIQAATALAQKKAMEKKLDADFDGELQVDAALVPDIAVRKSATRQNRWPCQRADFPRPELRQHRQQTGAAPRPRQRLWSNPVGTGPSGRGCVAWFKRARRPWRRGNRWCPSDRLSTALPRCWRNAAGRGRITFSAVRDITA